MKSKPVYGTLELDASARRHLFAVQGNGLDAALRTLEHKPGAVGACLLYTPGPDAVAWGAVQAGTHDASVFPCPADLLETLERELHTVGMDTAFYIAGPELFLWQATHVLREAGVEQRRIQQQLAGSKARSVYCVHCRTINERVTTTVHRCAGCGMALTVRDHFSRPLGAYMGVIIDAETPGLVPEPEMLYA